MSLLNSVNEAFLFLLFLFFFLISKYFFFYPCASHNNTFSKEADNDLSFWRITMCKEVVYVVTALKEGWRTHFGGNQEIQWFVVDFNIVKVLFFSILLARNGSPCLLLKSPANGDVFAVVSCTLQISGCPDLKPCLFPSICSGERGEHVQQHSLRNTESKKIQDNLWLELASSVHVCSRDCAIFMVDFTVKVVEMSWNFFCGGRMWFIYIFFLKKRYLLKGTASFIVEILLV